MNKSAVFLFVILAVLVFSSQSAPIEEEELQEQEGHVIAKRATCDLLSFEIAGFKLNDAGCAANCLRLGRKGGSCNSNKVCVCRY
ncbi:unnamed protein product [Ceutorhynchus assimilis]|uniref:Invertebrate defensins family profile domain-containing protein n=1 Tax=Ceutorhynchus assimilis TaxID=467358 RepID=A0A9N9MV33_9CUCU|nr:unnamed protein product [Ceutorhynchus assimilis]